MQHRLVRLAAIALMTGVLGACADSGLLGSSLTTASVDPAAQSKAAAAKVDPACVQLTARIDALRKEGFVERVEKASSGKSATVQVKRASLAKMTELEKANAEFQARCSTLPGPSQQAMAPAAAAPAAAAQKTVAAAAKPPATATKQAAPSESASAPITGATAAPPGTPGSP